MSRRVSRWVSVQSLVAALSTLAAAVAPTAPAQTPTVTSVIGSADGLFIDLAATGEFDESLAFGPTPSVTLPPEGGVVTDSIANVEEFSQPLQVVVLTAALVETSAEGALGPDGFATAETTVADLALENVPENVPDMEEEVGVLQEEGDILVAEAITATCSADLDGVSGSTTLVNATVLGGELGIALEEEPAPNTTVALPSVDPPLVFTGAITLNRQVQNTDGSLSVTALVIDIELQQFDGEELVSSERLTVEIGPATCGVVEGEEVPPAPQPVAAEPRFTG